MTYNLLINGAVYWGYNPLSILLLTSWDIQVYIEAFLLTNQTHVGSKYTNKSPMDLIVDALLICRKIYQLPAPQKKTIHGNLNVAPQWSFLTHGWRYINIFFSRKNGEQVSEKIESSCAIKIGFPKRKVVSILRAKSGEQHISTPFWEFKIARVIGLRLVNLFPPNGKPTQVNKGLIFGLIKGNQWFS